MVHKCIWPEQDNHGSNDALKDDKSSLNMVKDFTSFFEIVTGLHKIVREGARQGGEASTSKDDLILIRKLVDAMHETFPGNVHLHYSRLAGIVKWQVCMMVQACMLLVLFLFCKENLTGKTGKC